MPEVEVGAVWDKVAFMGEQKEFSLLGQRWRKLRREVEGLIGRGQRLVCRPRGDDFRRPKWLGETGVPETQIAAEGGFEALDRRKFSVAGPKKFSSKLDGN